MATSPFLTNAEYESVRKAIDVHLVEEDLPDDVIALDIYLKTGAQQVLALDPDAESRTGDAEDAIVMAAIFMVAAAIVPSLPQIMTEQFVDYRVKLQQFTPAEKIEELRRLASVQIAIATGADEGVRYRPLSSSFALGRARSNRSPI